MRKLFAPHLAAVGETYVQHLRMALGFGSRLVIAGLACIIHGLCPSLFQRTGSSAVETLHGEMVLTRGRKGGMEPWPDAHADG